VLEWRKRRIRKIRCPYCNEGGNFKVMIGQAGGGWFLCACCGHLSMPVNPLFQCTCSKCAGLHGGSGTRPLQI
jgi:hypothetical protein